MASSMSLQRKKLGSHFLESDERRFAGAPNAVGTTPLDIRGAPIPERDLPRTGGWTAAFFIFGNEMAERMAYYGLSVNMVVFLFKVMHLPFAASAGAVNTFLGISQASSVLGGFLADAYLGRYWTIAIFATLYLLGLVALTLAATLPSLVPSQQGCDTLAMLLGGCQQAERWQMAYLYAALYVTAFGAAGIRPCVSSFGADQFDDRDVNYKRRLDRFFNLFYLAVTVGAIAAFTLVVYIQMHHGWAAAFGALAIAMGASNALFFAGTSLYRHKAPGGSPLTRVAQVLVAAFRKRHAGFDSGGYVGLHEVVGPKSAIRGSAKIDHTDDFRWLDKAAFQLEDAVLIARHRCALNMFVVLPQWFCPARLGSTGARPTKKMTGHVSGSPKRRECRTIFRHFRRRCSNKLHRARAVITIQESRVSYHSSLGSSPPQTCH